MANYDAAIGFQPIRHLTGGEIRLVEMPLASGYTSAIGKGDVVEIASGKLAKPAAGNVDSIGVFAGVHYVDTNGNPVYSEYWPASTATKGSADAVALVWQDPLIVYRVQCDSLAAADVGKLADWDAGTPSATTRLSGLELVASAASTTQVMRILGLSSIPDNDFGAYAKADVVFAAHALLNAPASGG